MLWVDSLLIHPKGQMEVYATAQLQFGDGFDCHIDYGPTCKTYKRLSFTKQLQCFVLHRSWLNGNSSIIALAFHCRHGIAFGTWGNVRRLCKEGRLKEAMHLLDIMDQKGIAASSDVYARLLHRCANMKALMDGRMVHAHILKNTIAPDVFLENSLVNMYLKCGSVVDAHEVFVKMPKRNVYTWTTMIAGYAQNQQSAKALELFWQMDAHGVKPNKVTFVSILKACASIAALEQGKQIHALIVSHGFETDIFVGSALVDMYAKCKRMGCAQLVLNKMPKRGIVAWTAMIKGYAQYGQGEKALKSFKRMKDEGLKPDHVTFLTILKACASIAAFNQGKKIHTLIIQSGYDSNIYLANALVDMYVKCGCVIHARKVFDRMPVRDVISWNSMIAGYVEHDQSDKAFELFQEMKQKGFKPTKITLVIMLKACTKIVSVEKGNEIHGYSMENGMEYDIFVCSTLVDMYAKCGSLENAEKVFMKMPKEDVIAWNVMIAGYVQHGQGKKALKLFQQMRDGGVKPDKITFLSLLKACALAAALEQGKKIHNYIQNNGLDSDLFVGTTLIDMYAKCGSIENARQVFQQMPKRDATAWNTMLAAYAKHGLGMEAILLAQQMHQEGIVMDDVTFTSLLLACSHAGLVNEGCDCFFSLTQDGFVTPKDKHYACIVDLLGRAGHLDEAEDLVKRMPVQPTHVIWMSLLGACRTYGKLEFAKCSAELVLELDPQHAASLVLLSNAYAVAGRTDKKARLRALLEKHMEKNVI